MTPTSVVHLTDASFDETVTEAKRPVIVDFWAAWCGPCRAIGPTLEELAQEYAGRVAVAKVNVDEYPDLAARFRVRAIPTLLVFKGREVVDRMVGALSKPEIRKRLDAVT